MNKKERIQFAFLYKHLLELQEHVQPLIDETNLEQKEAHCRDYNIHSAYVLNCSNRLIEMNLIKFKEDAKRNHPLKMKKIQG